MPPPVHPAHFAHPADLRVLIAGGGVAGLETPLALRALAGDRVDVTLVAPELQFVNRSMAVQQPFRVQRALGLDGAFATGDATDFPVKQGGLAAQQADAVAEAIAASAGADIDPQPFRPILRGALLTGGPARYLRADISGAAGDDSIVLGHPLWWPPNKLCGRYLAPYVGSRLGEAAEVMPQDEHAILVETALDRVAPDTQGTFGELSDGPPR